LDAVTIYYTMDIDNTTLTDLTPNSVFVAIVIRSILLDDYTMELTLGTKQYQIWDITYDLAAKTYTDDASYEQIGNYELLPQIQNQGDFFAVLGKPNEASSLKYTKYIFYDREKDVSDSTTTIPALGTGPSYKEQTSTSGINDKPFAFMSTCPEGKWTRFYVHSFYAAA